jgi:hypothetical protein
MLRGGEERRRGMDKRGKVKGKREMSDQSVKRQALTMQTR